MSCICKFYISFQNAKCKLMSCVKVFNHLSKRPFRGRNKFPMHSSFCTYLIYVFEDQLPRTPVSYSIHSFPSSKTHTLNSSCDKQVVHKFIALRSMTPFRPRPRLLTRRCEVVRSTKGLPAADPYKFRQYLRTRAAVSKSFGRFDSKVFIF